MKIPKNVRIGPHVFGVSKVVKFQRDKNNPSKKDEDEDNLGELDYENLTIRIRKGMPESVEAEILLHEIVHGILMKLKLEEDLEEMIAETLGQDLLAVLRVNKIDLLGTKV